LGRLAVLHRRRKPGKEHDVNAVRVLIVDDSRMYAETLELLLDADERIDVVGRAEDGVEGVGQALALRPDVVVMDIHMPRLDGIGATRLIRARRPSTRVVVVTSSATGTHEALAYDAGATAYLHKDAPLDELRDAVAGCSAAAEAPAEQRACA
jgi:DNA-binding NarL/FixJ family response regulator